MFEKIDVTHEDGLPGGGGEYPVQTGFGWSNGVILELLDRWTAIFVFTSINPHAVGILNDGVESLVPSDSLRVEWLNQKFNKNTFLIIVLVMS